MGNKPRFEKVDAHTLKIIIEQITDVPISQLLDNKEKIHTDLKRRKVENQQYEDSMIKVLKNIDEMLEVAKELGIVPKKKVLKEVATDKNKTVPTK